MTKDPYDSIMPRGIRKILETQERLDRLLSPVDKFSKINSLTKFESFYPDSDLLKKMEAFNSINNQAYSCNSVTSALESLRMHDELHNKLNGIGISTNATPSTFDYFDNFSKISAIKNDSFTASEMLGISAGTLGYLDKFDEISRYSTFEKLYPWSEALKVQEALGLSDHIKTALKGINIDGSMFNGFIPENEYERAFQITSALNTSSIFFGEIENSYDLEDEEDNNENQKIILPEEFRERLETVQFLPIKLFEQISNDPDLMRGMDPREFENLIAELMYKSGFENIIVTPRSNDKGRDILATKTVCDIPIMFAFECKRYSPKNKIKPEIMRALLGTISHHQTKANKGVLVTTSSFSREAKSFIASESMLSGKDFNDLVKWINQVKK